MYKILFFLHKSVDEKILNHFKDRTIKLLKELSGKELELAEIESNLLSEQKYSYFCEAEFNSRDEMDRLMNSKQGLELNKDIMDFHKFLTVISVNYNKK